MYSFPAALSSFGYCIYLPSLFHKPAEDIEVVPDIVLSQDEDKRDAAELQVFNNDHCLKWFYFGIFVVLHVCTDNMIWYQSINSILHVINTNTDFNHQVEKMIVFLSYYFALEIEYWPTWTRGWWFEVVQSVRILCNLCRVLLGSVKKIRRCGFCKQGLNNVQEIV